MFHTLHEFFGLTHDKAHDTWWYIGLETFALTFLIMCIIELAGRKSINQLTMIQTVVFISIGEVVLMPVIEDDFHFGKSLYVVATLIIFLIIMEYLQMKFNLLEKVFIGKAKIIIKDGKMNLKELERQRLTVDQLESQIRLLGIKSFEQIKTATFESNGKIGYELKSEYEPLTRKEFYEVMNVVYQENENVKNIFDEIREGHDGEKHGRYK